MEGECGEEGGGGVREVLYLVGSLQPFFAPPVAEGSILAGTARPKDSRAR